MAATPPLMDLFEYRVDIGDRRQCRQSRVDPTRVIIALTYFTIILNAMLSITRIFVIVSKGLASTDRIQSVLRLPQNMQVIEAPVKEESAHIVFEKFPSLILTYPVRKTSISPCSREKP